MREIRYNLESIPVLSIRQPWAWMIINLGKDIENRTWKTNFRGEFYIHASKSCTQKEYWNAYEFAKKAIDEKYRCTEMPSFKNIPRGGIVGKAEIVDCVNESVSPWFMGDYGFVLRNIEPVEFLPCKGQLGFFNPKLTQ